MMMMMMMMMMVMMVIIMLLMIFMIAIMMAIIIYILTPARTSPAMMQMLQRGIDITTSARARCCFVLMKSLLRVVLRIMLPNALRNRDDAPPAHAHG